MWKSKNKNAPRQQLVLSRKLNLQIEFAAICCTQEALSHLPPQTTPPACSGNQLPRHLASLNY